MKPIIKFAVNNPVAVNLIFIGVLAIGWLMLGTLPREVFPEFAKDSVEVQVLYPNASADEIERLCVIPIEEAADGLQGTYEVSSTARQDMARIFIRLSEGTDLQEYLDELRQEVDIIQDWPQDAEDPRIFEQKVQFPVVTINLFGNLDEWHKRDVAERLRDRVKTIPGVSSITLLGLRDPELRVEVMPAQLERFGISLTEIAALLGPQVRDLPGGTLETPAGETVLRILGEETDPVALGQKVIRALPDGTLVRIADVAMVRQDFEKALTNSRYNGCQSVSLQIAKDKVGDTITIVDSVKRMVEEFRPTLPQGLSMGISSDFSIYVKNRLRTLLQSGFFGLALVLLILWVFLDARTALMTAMGIPVAVMGGVIAMSFLGITMNMLSMFAFILVLGLVVDDAIVVVENCYRYVERGMHPRDAALQGCKEVAWPVVTTVCTTVAAFGAILMIEGELGQWMKPVPWVAGLTLVASLIEALLVLPSHFADWVKPHMIAEIQAEAATGEGPNGRQRGRWYDGLQRFYEWSLRHILHHRYPAALAALGTIVIAGALFQFGHLKFVLMPKFEAKLFFVNVETPTSNSLDQTYETLRYLENEISQLPAYELESYVALAGATYSDQQNYRNGSHLGQVFVELAEGGERTRSTDEIQADLRQRFAGAPGVLRMDFQSPQAGPVGKPIEMRLYSQDDHELSLASLAVQKKLKSYAGVFDVRDDLLPGTREIRFRLTDEGRMLGFHEVLLGQQVLAAFYGNRAAILRLGRDPADLLVRNPEALRLDFTALRQMRVKSPAGEWLPLDRVAHLDETAGLAQISRRNRQRSVTITADVEASTNARDVMDELTQYFAEEFMLTPSVTLDYGGDTEATRESMESLARAMMISFLIIYFLLAFLFRSYLQPVVVLFAVPFGALGVFFGFSIIGQPLSFMTMLGVLALSGVAVNDALVLVDFINQHRRQGHGLIESVHKAGAVRMRPVLITSLTTIGGLIPLAFFASGQAKFLSPMALSLVFGMVSATVMTLILVPVLYVILHDFHKLAERITGRSWSVIHRDPS
jgi:multidrug efflux pump subunit AcrB